jgi:hypothetical protein
MALAAFTGMLVLGALEAHAQPQCSNASLRGSYGFHAVAIVVPAGTPRAIIGVFHFDGGGNWTGSLTINNNGTIMRLPSEGGAYIVNADCTGTFFPTSGGTIEMVVVDDGREIFQMRTDPSVIVMYSSTKKLLRGSSQ